jgi:hypothetical protein
MITKNENDYYKNIYLRINQMKEFLIKKEFPNSYSPQDWYTYLNGLKTIQGNSSNDLGFIATMMAKVYLERKYGVSSFDAASKPQGAPGLDIDLKLSDGRRLIAEIKTTSPYKSNDLGAQQKATFEKDFDKLILNEADIKLFMLTERTSYNLMKSPKYCRLIPGIIVVLLSSSEEFTA